VEEVYFYYYSLYLAPASDADNVDVLLPPHRLRVEGEKLKMKKLNLKF